MDSTNGITALPPLSARSISSPRGNVASAKPRPKLLAALRKSATSSSEGEYESEDDRSVLGGERAVPESNNVPTTASSPRPGANKSDDEKESDGETAYQRMKKRLAASKNAVEVQEIQPKSLVTTTTESSGDESLLPRRTTTRKSAAKTSNISGVPSSPVQGAQSRQSSPGLFVTPHSSPVKSKSKQAAGTSSDSDNSSRSSYNADMQERIRRIRAKRLARQEEEDGQQQHSRKLVQRQEEGSGNESDDENGKRLTQQAKPTRKAGKKALEAMARDQQRISRNMQLTHQAKTRKRYSTKDLFARMGFNAPHEQVETLPTPDASSVLASSDAEAGQLQDTPPTSPPTQEECVGSDSTLTKIEAAATEENNGQEPESCHPLLPSIEVTQRPIVQNAKVDNEQPKEHAMVELSDSEDDVEKLQPKTRFPVFDRLPTKKQHEPASLLHLRSLAQLAKSPQKRKNGQKQVTLAEMEWSLAQKARQQRNQQREERIAELKQRGHIIETEEEREKHQMEIEDMVAQFEKQRQEDLDLAKMERDEAKKNGETVDDLPSSDESDGDFVDSEAENGSNNEAELEADAELEFSGSEEEMADVEDIEEEEDITDQPEGLVDDEADEGDEGGALPRSQQLHTELDTDDEDVNRNTRKQTINRSRHRVVDEEDDSDKELVNDGSLPQQKVQDNAMAAFGFNNANAGLGLTQMFAGTMAELESDSQTNPLANTEPEQDSLDFLRNLPGTQPIANLSQASDFMVPNSQSFTWPREESQTNPETQFSLGISQLVKTSPAFSRTQPEDFEPTQDAGFSFSRSPVGLIPPPSTAETVMMSIAESPIKVRKNRLQRGRREATVELSDVDEDMQIDQDAASEDDMQRPPKPSNAFFKMKKAAEKQKAIEEFNKKTSLAKEAVMEQAEESEDEYAGLGGASDDEEGEEDQELKDMIDHSEVNVDERQIAAFYADKAKREDEKNIADLYKKMQTGGLRRQAAGRDGFDMSDSEDEAELRQRKKQAEFQKMSRALLKDERVKQLADDPKKKPFFNTLADFADEGDYGFLDMPAETGADGQDESQEDAIVPDSQSADTTMEPGCSNPLKRKSNDSQKENRPPPQLRRTVANDNLTRKPMTLADVQHSVSELLEDGRIMVPDSQYSDSEGEEACPAPNACSRKAVVDRLSLSRTPTIECPADSNMAFHAPARTLAVPGFGVPSLIRRATSNMSTASESRSESRGSSGTNTPTENAVRRGGTGRSNIHAQAREAERRALLEKKDGKRKAALKKKVEGGRKRTGGIRSVLGDLGGGFE